MSQKIHYTTKPSINDTCSDKEQETKNENDILSTISTFFGSVVQQVRNMRITNKDKSLNEALVMKGHNSSSVCLNYKQKQPVMPESLANEDTNIVHHPKPKAGFNEYQCRQQKQFRNLQVQAPIGGHDRQYSPVLIQNSQPSFHPIELGSSFYKKIESPKKLNSLLLSSNSDMINEVNDYDLSHEKSNYMRRLSQGCVRGHNVETVQLRSDTVSKSKGGNDTKSKFTYRKTHHKSETQNYLNNAINKLKGLILKKPKEYEHPILDKKLLKTVHKTLKETGMVSESIDYNQNKDKHRFSFHESLSNRKVSEKKKSYSQINSPPKDKDDTNVTIFVTCLNKRKKSLVKQGSDLQERFARYRNKSFPKCVGIPNSSCNDNRLESVLKYFTGEVASPQKITSTRNKKSLIKKTISL